MTYSLSHIKEEELKGVKKQEEEKEGRRVRGGKKIRMKRRVGRKNKF